MYLGPATHVGDRGGFLKQQMDRQGDSQGEPELIHSPDGCSDRLGPAESRSPEFHLGVPGP